MLVSEDDTEEDELLENMVGERSEEELLMRMLVETMKALLEERKQMLEDCIPLVSGVLVCTCLSRGRIWRRTFLTECLINVILII